MLNIFEVFYTNILLLLKVLGRVLRSMLKIIKVIKILKLLKYQKKHAKLKYFRAQDYQVFPIRYFLHFY